MQTDATIQQKAMQDIFALDEAVGQFESFGSQLDLGLPTEEDDSPKSFDDMLEVNPSNEPMEYGENFMSEGDDLQDQQTQKFVVDEFAKQLAELPDGSNVTAADITGISAIIQMNNHITGDVRSFIDQTINHAVQAQQQQNVSEAQPNGTVAQDLAKTGDNADAGVSGTDPTLGGNIPTMDPIDPTAEPSLDANPAGDLGLGADVGDPLAGMDNGLGGDELGGDLGADAGADAGAEEDPLAGMDDGLAGIEGNEPDPEAPEAAEPSAEGDADLDNFLDNDEGTEGGETAGSEDGGETEPSADDDETESTKSEGADESEDNDDDFNFEAIATKARGLVEEADGATIDGNAATTETPVDETVVGAAQNEGVDNAEADLGGTTETDNTSTDEAFECSFNEKQAKVESIVNKAKMKMAADEANAILESYHKDRERATTLAKLDGVVNSLKQKVLTESIVSDYAQKSKKRAQVEAIVEKVYNETEPAPSVFESTMARINEALSHKPSVSEEADKVIAEFEAAQKAKKPAVTESILNPTQKRINNLLESAAKKESVEKTFAGKLNSLLEGVKQSQAAKAATSNLDKQLNDIVAQVKNS